MDDLISRQAVIDLFNSVFSDEFIPFARARMFIDCIYHAVPSVTPQQKLQQGFIYKGKVDGLFYIIVDDSGEEGYVKAKRISDQYNYIIPINDLEAWMPLPEPYKEEQDVKNNTDND